MTFQRLFIISIIILFFILCILQTINSQIRNRVKQYAETLSDDFVCCYKYLKSNHYIVIGCVLLFCLSYGYNIVTCPISLDEEFQFYQPANFTQWCYEGRFSIAVLKTVFLRYSMYVPYLATFIGAFIYTISGLIALISITEHFETDNKFLSVIFLGFYMTQPHVLMDMLAFSTYSIEVAFGILLSIVSARWIYLGIQKRDLLLIITSCILCAFAIGIYQAIASVFITMIIILTICRILAYSNYSLNTLKTDFITILFIALTFFLSIIIFYLLYSQSTAMHYVPDSVTYVNGYACWGQTSSLFQDFKQSLHSLLLFLRNTQGFLGIGYIRLPLVLGVGLSIINFFINKGIRRIIIPLLNIMLVACLFLMWIVLGVSTTLPYRVWLSLPLASAFIYMYFLYTVDRLIKPSILRIAILFCTGIILFGQIQVLNLMYYIDNIRYQKDAQFANEIYYDICHIADPTGKIIVLVGTRDLAEDSSFIKKNPSTNERAKTDVLGYSIFRRGDEPHRMEGFFGLLGYDLNFELPTEDEINWVNNNMAIYPLKEGIAEHNGKIYIRLQ